MFRTPLLGAAVLLTLAGCGQFALGDLNPLNLLNSRQTEEAPAAIASDAPDRLIPDGRRTLIVDGRSLVQSISSLSIDRGPTGAIVTAVGVAPKQGYFDAQLINAGVSGGVLVLQFRAQSAGGATVGTAQSRQISASYVIDTGELTDIRTVRVEAATNAQTATP